MLVLREGIKERQEACCRKVQNKLLLGYCSKERKKKRKKEKGRGTEKLQPFCGVDCIKANNSNKSQQ